MFDPERPDRLVLSVTCLGISLAIGLASPASGEGQRDARTEVERLIRASEHFTAEPGIKWGGERSEALEDVVRVGEPAVPALIRGLENPNSEVRSVVCAAIYKIGAVDASTRSALIKALDRVERSNSWYMLEYEGYSLAMVLAKMGPSAVEPLVTALSHRRPAARAVAAFSLSLGGFALGSIHAAEQNGPNGRKPYKLPAGAITPLLGLLKDREAIARSGALMALCGLDSNSGRVDEVVTSVIACLADPNDEVKVFALGTVAHFGPKAKAAVKVLSDMFEAVEKDRDSAVDFEARLSEFLLGIASRLEPRAFAETRGFVLRNLCMSPLSPQKFQIAQALGALGQEAAPAAPMLIRRAKDPKVEFRENAIYVLGKIGAHAEGVLPTLRAAMNDPEESVRTRASEALSALDKSGSLKSTR